MVAMEDAVVKEAGENALVVGAGENALVTGTGVEKEMVVVEGRKL
jgi:hypothetical protein